MFLMQDFCYLFPLEDWLVFLFIMLFVNVSICEIPELETILFSNNWQGMGRHIIIPLSSLHRFLSSPVRNELDSDPLKRGYMGSSRDLLVMCTLDNRKSVPSFCLFHLVIRNLHSFPLFRTEYRGKYQLAGTTGFSGSFFLLSNDIIWVAWNSRFMRLSHIINLFLHAPRKKPWDK